MKKVTYLRNLNIIDIANCEKPTLNKVVDFIKSNPKLEKMTDFVVSFLDKDNVLSLENVSSVKELFNKGCKRSVELLKKIDELVSLPLQDIGRVELGDKIYKLGKTFLPAITFGEWHEGTRRKAENMCQHSGYFGVDIDDKEGLLNLDETIKAILGTVFGENVLVIYKTPSRKGLRIILNTNLTHINFNKVSITRLLLSLEQELQKINRDIRIDMSCIDPLRLFFLASDKDVYFNEKATILDVSIFADINYKLSESQERLKRRVMSVAPVEVPSFSIDTDDFLGTTALKFASAIEHTEDSIGKRAMGTGNNFFCHLHGACLFKGLPSHESMPLALSFYARNQKDRDHIKRIWGSYSGYGEKVYNSNIPDLISHLVDEGERPIDIVEVDKYITESTDLSNVFVNKTLNQKVLVIAPTGSGKTKAIGKLVEANQKQGVVTIIIAPNKLVSNQIAESFGTVAINEDTPEKTNFKNVYNREVVATTYTSFDAVMNRLNTHGVNINKVHIVMDEAHSIMEQYRQNTMLKILSGLKEIKRCTFLTATASKYVIEMLNPNSIIYYSVSKRIMKKVSHVKLKGTTNKGVVAAIVETAINENNKNKLKCVFINSGLKIKEVVNALKELRPDLKVGVLLSKQKCVEHGLTDNDISIEVGRDNLIPEDYDLVLMTSVCEYGVNFENEREIMLLIIDTNQTIITPAQFIQVSSRFRKPKNDFIEIVRYTIKTDSVNKLADFDKIYESYMGLALSIESAYNKCNSINIAAKGKPVETMELGATSFSCGMNVQPFLCFYDKKEKKYVVDTIGVYNVAMAKFMRYLSSVDYGVEVGKIDSSFLFRVNPKMIDCKQVGQRIVLTVGGVDLYYDSKVFGNEKLAKDIAYQKFIEFTYDLVEKYGWEETIQQYLAYAVRYMDLRIENVDYYTLPDKRDIRKTDDNNYYVLKVHEVVKEVLDFMPNDSIAYIVKLKQIVRNMFQISKITYSIEESFWGALAINLDVTYRKKLDLRMSNEVLQSKKYAEIEQRDILTTNALQFSYIKHEDLVKNKIANKELNYSELTEKLSRMFPDLKHYFKSEDCKNELIHYLSIDTHVKVKRRRVKGEKNKWEVCYVIGGKKTLGDFIDGMVKSVSKYTNVSKESLVEHFSNLFAKARENGTNNIKFLSEGRTLTNSSKKEHLVFEMYQTENVESDNYVPF